MEEFEPFSYYYIKILDHYVDSDMTLDKVIESGPLTISFIGLYLGDSGAYHVFARDVEEGYEEDQYDTFHVLKGTIVDTWMVQEPKPKKIQVK